MSLPSVVGGNSMQNMVCTKCSWTRFTGGMTEDMHDALGHGPLVPESSLKKNASPVKKKCKNCKVVEGSSSSSTPCRFHTGKKENWKRMMAVPGAHVIFTWSCCGAKVDYHEGSIEEDRLKEQGEGCQSAPAHEFV